MISYINHSWCFICSMWNFDHTHHFCSLYYVRLESLNSKRDNILLVFVNFFVSSTNLSDICRFHVAFTVFPNSFTISMRFSFCCCGMFQFLYCSLLFFKCVDLCFHCSALLVLYCDTLLYIFNFTREAFFGLFLHFTHFSQYYGANYFIIFCRC